MTVEIPLSKIESREAFALAVDAHITELTAHLTGEPGIASPRASDLVEAAIRRASDTEGPVENRKPDSFVADYQIVDDTPPPPTLAERKRNLLAELAQKSEQAKAEIISPARLSLLMMDVADAAEVEQGKRTPGQAAAIARLDDYQAKAKAIQRRAAQIAIEVEDLTDAMIGGFKLKF